MIRRPVKIFGAVGDIALAAGAVPDGVAFAGTEEAPGETVHKAVVLPESQKTVKVPFKRKPLVILKDADRNDANPFVVRFDLNRGNKQIAHGISLVLRPVDL